MCNTTTLMLFANQSIESMLINFSFFFLFASNFDDSKQKTNSIEGNIARSIVLCCRWFYWWLCRWIISRFEIFLSLSIFFISMFCGFKLCDSVIHQNHCMAISFALFFSLTLFDVVRSGRAKEHWHIFFFFFSLLKSAFPLPSYPYSLFISSWLLMLWHQFKEEKKITQ